MSKKQQRIKTKQPGVYLNQATGKYDVKYSYKEYDMLADKMKYRAKWRCGILSYKEAVKLLTKMKIGEITVENEDITLKEALDLWMNKATANNYSKASISNTKQQYNMIAKFWSPDVKLCYITEDNYLELISKCRNYGYAEETIYNINACLRKLVRLAYRNRYLKENPFDYCDNARIQPKIVNELVTHKEYLKLDDYFATNEFWRLGVNHYPKYRLLLRLLYWTGIRIGEAIALTYQDFEEYCNGKMFVHITKAYNSVYKLLKGTKNDKTRKIPLSQQVIVIYKEILNEQKQRDEGLDERIFTWDHGACTVMIKKACREVGIQEYNCHAFRHTYISNLIRQCIPISVIEQVSGDTQATILRRYSHVFEGDEEMILEALKSIK